MNTGPAIQHGKSDSSENGSRSQPNAEDLDAGASDNRSFAATSSPV
jgi:hypothetical protein